MKILMLHMSPKRKGGASRFFSRLLKLFLLGCKVETEDVFNVSQGEKVIEKLRDIDVLVLSTPLYNDSVPAHIIPFLTNAEQYCLKNKCSFKVYAISNAGFIEGIQNRVHLKIYEAWCKRANAIWKGGIGIGGGVMSNVLSILLPIFILIASVQLGIQVMQSGSVSVREFISANVGVLIALILNLGVYLSVLKLAISIRLGRYMKNFYTRILLPSCLFIIVADIFMMIQYILQLPRRFKHLEKR